MQIESIDLNKLTPDDLDKTAKMLDLLAHYARMLAMYVRCREAGAYASADRYERKMRVTKARIDELGE